MQEGRASRWSFLQPPTVAAGAEAAPARPGRRAVRSRAGRAADAAAQEAACPAAAEEQQQGFVFMATPGPAGSGAPPAAPAAATRAETAPRPRALPVRLGTQARAWHARLTSISSPALLPTGGASLGAKAARSSARKHTPHRGAGSPGTPFDGSPMQWSPAVEGELGEGLRAGATPGSGSSASASRGAWARPGSNANIAPPAAADGIAVELLARLHLGGDGGGAHENLPQAPASKPPSPVEQQPAEVPPPAEASSAEPVAAEFVFAAQGSCSPAQRQPGRSPVGGGRRKPAAQGAGGAPPPSPATAGPTAAPAPAPQPPIPPPSAAVCFVFEARQPAAPGDGDSASAQREPPASSQPPVPFPSAAAAAAEPPQFVYGAAPLQSAAQGDGVRKPAAAAVASAAAPPFVFGGSQQPAAAAPGNAAAPFVFAGQPLGAAAAAVPAAPAVAGVQSAGQAASEASCSGPEAAAQEQQQPLSKAVRKFRRRPAPALSSSAAQPAGAGGWLPEEGGMAIKAAGLAAAERGWAGVGHRRWCGIEQMHLAAMRSSRQRACSCHWIAAQHAYSPYLLAHSLPHPGAGLGPMLLPSQPGASLFAQAASSGSSGPGVQQAQPPPVSANLAQEMVAASRSESERNLGNEAFKAQDYQAALEAYTKVGWHGAWHWPPSHPQGPVLPRCRASSTRLPAHSEAALHSAFPVTAPPSL